MKKTKIIYKQLKDFKIYYFIAFLLLGCDAFVTYYYPYILTDLIDIFLPSKDSDRIMTQLILLGTFQIISIVVASLLSIMFNKMTNKFIFKIKNMIINAIFRSKGEELPEKSERFLACMGSDINNIQMLTSRMMADFIMEVITLIITIIIICKINYFILLLIVILYPVLLGIQKVYNKKIQKRSKKLMTYIDYENSYTKEFSLFMEQYILMNIKQYYLNKFNKNEKLLLGESFKLSLDLEYNGMIPRIIGAFAYIIVLGISSFMVINNKIMIGEFTIVLLYTQRVFAPLRSIMFVIGQLQKTKVSVERISDIF